jgi:nucleotide-binding universal stress UspA family protein
MYAEARTSLAASLLPLRIALLFAGVALVEVSLLAGAALWTVAAATVVASIVIARSIDRRRPHGSTLTPDASHVPAPVPVDRAPAPAVTDGSTSAAKRPSIVCGVDGSAESQAAVAVATRLAERLDSRLVLAHAIDADRADHVPVAIGAGAVGARRLSVPTDDRARAAASLVSRSAEMAPASGAECRVAVGFAADRLADLAEEEQAERLVVGTRGRGLKAAFLGSVSSNLIGVARCPVLVVPPGAAGR